MVGLNAADDAAVYRISEDRAIVTTTDFFPPVVDDPYDFGAIAAANALSDIYAMGATPLYAINLVAYPSGLDLDYLRLILKGGAEKIAEAGAVIAGGHSVSDKEPKYGLTVTGIINPLKIKIKGGAKPDDQLFLTKPLGTGVITTALKQEKAKPGDVAAAVTSMKTLNREAAEAAEKVNVIGMTDITGFGLLGHAHEMAHLSNVDFHIELASIPWLPGAAEYGSAGSFPGGMFNNASFFQPWVQFGSVVSKLYQDLLWTPETSGGLLVAIPRDQVGAFQSLFDKASSIGSVHPGHGHLFVD